MVKGRSWSPAKRQVDAAGRGVRTHIQDLVQPCPQAVTSQAPLGQHSPGAGRVAAHLMLLSQGSGELLSPWRSEKCFLPFAHRGVQGLERGSPLRTFHLPTAGAKGRSCGLELNHRGVELNPFPVSHSCV